MRSVELFAGAGGLGMGVARAGFRPELVVEWNRYCCDTIRENQAAGLSEMADWPLVEGDVRQVDVRHLEGKIDFVSGGPPCQPFSLGGKHRGYLDPRDMFPQAIRVVRETKPRAFVFENVKGLTRTSFQNYLEYIKLQLTYPELTPKSDEEWLDHLKRLERHHTHGGEGGLHYRLVHRVLNAADYGVPQKRERIFLVGIRADLGVEWNFPDATHSQEALLWSQVRDGTYWDHHSVARRDRKLSATLTAKAQRVREQPSLKPWRTVRDALAGLPDPELEPTASKYFLNHRFNPGARSYAGHTGSPLDEPAKTLKAGDHGVPGGENMLLRPNGAVRYFTVRESARLQGFPDDFVFHGSWGEVMRQLGNAVPVPLGEVVARHVRDHLASALTPERASTALM